MSEHEDMLKRARAIIELVEQNKETIERQDKAYDEIQFRTCTNCRYITSFGTLDSNPICSHPLVQTASLLRPKDFFGRRWVTECMTQRRLRPEDRFRPEHETVLCGTNGLLFEPAKGLVKKPSFFQRLKTVFIKQS